jgi:hypothetical protein
MPPSAGLFCLQTIENTMEGAGFTRRGRSVFLSEKNYQNKAEQFEGVFDPIGTRQPSSGHPIASEFVTAFSHWPVAARLSPAFF